MKPNCASCGHPICNCGLCHNCTANASSTTSGTVVVGSLTTMFPSLTSMPSGLQASSSPMSPTNSQKVKGIAALRNSLLGSHTVPIRGHITKASDLEALSKISWEWPLFARPCPVSPQHGFVDSRKVKSWDEVLKVWAETQAADPDGELILMPLISASHNAIWTPTLVTVGKGHDGATAGKETVTVPLIGLIPETIELNMVPAGVVKPEDPYIEAVWVKGSSGQTPKLTQLRAGPHIDAVGLDWIPADIVVEKVLSPAGEDLLAWAKVIKQATPGTVVWHPGGSPADHYFVHCRLSQIPVVTTFEPKPGDQLMATPQAPPPDPKAVLMGIAMADRYAMAGSDVGRLVPLMLLALHHSAAMSGPHGKWLGLAVGIMLRAGSLALRGEARHRINLSGSKASGASRDQVYARMASRSLSFHRASLNRLAVTFQYGQWSGKGYGGPKWAKCAKSLQGLFNGIQRLAAKPDDQAVADLVAALNIAVNQAHNGGWWMNKFVSSDIFDTIQEGSLMPTLSAAKQAHEVMTRGVLKPDTVDQLVARYASWPQTEIRAPRLQSVEITSLPGVSGLVLSVKSRLIGKHMHSIPITLDKLNSMLESAVTNARMQESPGGGLKLVADISSMNATLWETPAITLEAE